MQHNDEKHSIQRSQDITYFFFWKGKSRVKSWWWFNLSATSGCNFPVSIIAVVSFLESVILWGWELLLLGFWLQYFLWLEVMGNYLYGFYSLMDSYPLPSDTIFFFWGGRRGTLILFSAESLNSFWFYLCCLSFGVSTMQFVSDAGFLPSTICFRNSNRLPCWYNFL